MRNRGTVDILFSRWEALPCVEAGSGRELEAIPVRGEGLHDMIPCFEFTVIMVWPA